MNIPGIQNLLRPVDMDTGNTVKSCQNSLLPILAGIEAIGDWMTQDAEHIGLNAQTLSNTGYLLRFLAGLALDLHHIEADAQFDMRTCVDQQHSGERRAA
mgnify:CR=1 FL=1